MKMKINTEEIWENIKYIGLGIIFALILNKGMGYILHTSTPIVAVMTNSMVHDATTPYRHYQFLQENFDYSKEEIDSWPVNNGFRPGDVLVIKGVPEDELKVGDVIVFAKHNKNDNTGQKEYDIIHRIVYIDDEGYPFTKGDHNPVIDPDCNLFENSPSGCWERVKIKGKAVLLIKYLGWPKLILQNIIFWVGGLF